MKFDGIPVAAWIAPYLHWAQEHGGWQGTIVSGWRSPEHSEQVCIQKCGQVKCPGNCAGRSSHHVGRVKPLGAVDVTLQAQFADAMRRCPYKPKLFNALPKDQNHFSATGN